MRNRFLLVCVAVSVIAMMMVTGCAQTAPAPAQSPAPAPKPAAQPITLKGVAGWPVGDITNNIFEDFMDTLSKQSGGQIKVNYAGGPEAIATYDQPEAVRTGVVDLNNSAGSYFATFAPELTALSFAQLSPEELRKNGFNDVINRLSMKKANVMFLGYGTHEGLQLFMNKKIAKLGDLSGLKIRGSPASNHVIKALGAGAVSLQPSEIYTALQRGVIDGYVIGPTHPTSSAATHEVLKYAVEPTFNRGGPSLWMNVDTYNRLSAEMQTLVQKVMADVEKKWTPIKLKEQEKNQAEWKKVGMEIINLSPEDARLLLKTADEANWQLMDKTAPGWDPKLRELSRPK